MNNKPKTGNDFLKFTVDNFSESVVIVDADARFIYANKSVCNSLGYSKEEMLDLRIFDIDPDFPPDVWPKFWKDLKKGNTITIQTRNRTKDGTVFPVEITANYLSYNGTEFGCAFAKDITDRKKTEEDALVFKFISDNANDAHFLSGRDAMFYYVNDTACRMMGYSYNELVNLGVPDVDNLYDISKYQELFDMVQKETVPSFETINKRKDGTTFPSEITVTGYQIDGRPFMFAALRDITERKKADEDLLNIAKGVSSKIGEGVFTELTEHVANILEANYAYIAEIIPDKPNHAKTRSLIADGKFIDNIEVNLDGTPCETIINKGISSFPANVQKLFPRAHMISELNVASYVGIPLLSSSGECIGIMSVMYRKPIEDDSKIISLLKIFASRASSEIERKRSEEALAEAHDELEAKVERRTSELEESNAALKVLLKQRDSDKAHLETNILTNIKQLILPYIDKIRNNGPEKDTLTSLSILEANLKEIVSPFANKLSSNYLGLTPKEIDISNLIIIGKQDKEISKILNISPETVKSHRQNIRKKLGIYSKRTNLRTYLLSLSD